MLKILSSRKYNSSPIFVLGTGRSGTTLLQRVLNSGENVSIWGEHGGFLSDIAEAYFLNLEDKTICNNILKINHSASNPKATANKLKNPAIWSAWLNWYNQNDTEENFRSFIESFFKPKSLKNKIRWGFKEIRYGKDDRTIEMLSSLYPEAKFIFITRNPIDVVAAHLVKRIWKLAGKGANVEPSQLKALREECDFSIQNAAELWAKQNSYFIEFSNKNSHISLITRYEDLITELNEFENIFKWLNVKYESKNIKNILEMKEGRGESKINKQKSRDILTSDDMDIIRKITQEISVIFHYPEF